MVFVIDFRENGIDHLKKFIVSSEGERISFICPIAFFTSAGPCYWITRGQKLQQEFPHKKLVFWHHTGDKAGYALGALRMGARHLIFTGPEKTFHNIKNIAKHYQAVVIPSEKYVEI